MNLESWIAGGERIAIELASGSFEIFRRIEGSGPSVTLLHGFPTSSWDWAAVTAQLREQFRVLAFDFLGFGDSAKPRRHRYDLVEQADLVEAMWAASGVTETIIVAHDYGVSVAKELLARAGAGTSSTRLRGAVLLNGILYEELHRPLAIQRLLLNPLTGPVVTRLVRERDFARSFARVFSKAHPLDPEGCRQHWQAVSRHAGTRIYDRLIRYLADGRRHAPRWRTTLRETAVPLWFVWGAEDPVTGMSMIEELRRERPDARVTELTTVGHYPQLEVPDEIVRAIRRAHATLAPTR